MNVLLIGYNGRVAQRHIKAWVEMGHTVHACLKEHDVHDRIRDVNPDIIDIATPVYLHVQQILELYDYDIPIICEKPISTTVEEAKILLSLPGKIGIIYQFRFNPKVLKLRKEVLSGKYGDIKFVTATYFRNRGNEYYRKWEGDKLKAGGGVLLNVCIHYVDLMQWIFGYPTQVKGMMATSKNIDVDDNAAVIMRFPNGGIGSLNLSTHANPPKHFELSVYGTKGHTTIQLRQNEYHKANFEAFINNGDYLRPIDALKSLQIVENAYISNNA